MNHSLFSKWPLSALLIFCAVFLACKKPVDPANDTHLSKNKTPLPNLAGIPAYPLDWEHIDFMPSPAGTPPIPVPWSSGLGGRKMDEDIVFDYKKADGWELVYNTFNNNVVYNPAYFMLYNKYRGLLRTYFYFSTPANYPSSNLNYQLKLLGTAAANSPILNFSSKDVIKINDNAGAVSQLQQHMVSSTGSWYAAEFEIAYDHTIGSTDYQNLQFEWSINPNSITQISLNGKETGTISGTIEHQQPAPNFFANLPNGVIDAGMKIGSKKAAENLKFPKSEQLKNAIIDAASNGVSGLIKGFLSGLLGGGGSTTVAQQVNLKINSTIETSGTATVSSQLFTNTFSIPGTLNNQNSPGFYPSYNQPLGLFYLSAEPIIKVKRTTYNLDSPPSLEGARVRFDFSIDEPSHQILFNPALLAVADISNLRKQIILTKTFGSDVLDRDASILSSEIIAEREIYEVERLTLVGSLPTSILTSNILMRISFDVTPKDGSPKITVVKTFKSTGQPI
ncbi:hypothetical protein C7T94_18050 [Pedobacter yulinensis]|uniref:DUF4270 domain-containing protein n=1 Tax=Pedobacter yulinensis TaxID=2126353 RepID=A0A2T3HH54_9SPHI|nr:hypothetical protein [Pedobacter yulinensis]PST81774.1 hypothetical protein C7T94_18050 [Pedobacter yulinensis]